LRPLLVKFMPVFCGDFDNFSYNRCVSSIIFARVNFSLIYLLPFDPILFNSSFELLR